MNQVNADHVLRGVWAELRCAHTIAADPSCEPASALIHVYNACCGLAWLSHGNVPSRGTDDLSPWFAPRHIEIIDSKTRIALPQTLALAARHAESPPPWCAPASEPAPTSLVSGQELTRQLRALTRLAHAVEQERGGASLRSQRAKRWGRRGIAAFAGLAVVTLLALRPWQDTNNGPWRAAYYPSEDFRGVPDVRRHLELRFNWAQRPPTESIPADNFSARFDSCLVLDNPSTVALMLLADDGARVFVDGRNVIEHWTSRNKPNGTRLELGSGAHHLRVDYHERVGNASVELTASFDENEPPSAIPHAMLAYPHDDESAGNACVGVR